MFETLAKLCPLADPSPVGFNNVSAVYCGVNGTEISTKNLPREVNILTPQNEHVKVSHVGRTYCLSANNQTRDKKICLELWLT